MTRSKIWYQPHHPGLIDHPYQLYTITRYHLSTIGYSYLLTTTINHSQQSWYNSDWMVYIITRFLQVLKKYFSLVILAYLVNFIFRLGSCYFSPGCNKRLYETMTSERHFIRQWIPGNISHNVLTNTIIVITWPHISCAMSEILYPGRCRLYKTSTTVAGGDREEIPGIISKV